MTYAEFLELFPDNRTCLDYLRDRFYPAGTRPSGYLRAYAERLPALELNATFRRRPTASAIAGWVKATPPDFRFATKAQRGSAFRALSGEPAPPFFSGED